MSDIPPGDPLGGPPQPPQIPGSSPEAPQIPGYTAPPPPGAGGPVPPASFGEVPTGALRLASWGSRLGAALIDGLILTAGAVVLVVVVLAAFAGSDVAGTVTAIVAFLAYVAVAFLYSPLMMSRTNGKTLGRMVTNVRVVRTDGQPMTFGLAALREVVLKGVVANVIPFGWFVDGLWPLWDDQNRAVHDFITNTRVVVD